MALVPTSFLKILPHLPHQVTSGEATANTLTISYSDRVEDDSTIAVYYNGQLVENSTINPSGRFYYSFTKVLGTVDPDTGADSGSSIDITMTRNISYIGPGYTSGTAASTLSSYDNFTVSYYYVIYTPV